MALPKIIALVVMLVFCVTMLGLGGGLIAAFKKKDKDKGKKIGISFCVFLILTLIAYKVMMIMP